PTTTVHGRVEPKSSGSEAPSESLRAPAPRIGGWLIIPGLGMAFGPFYLAGTLLTVLMTGEGFQLLVVLFLAALLAFFVFAAIAFFRRLSIAPKLIIALYVLNFLGQLSGPADPVRRVFAVVWVGIWIPYFLVSKRVKATFVFPRLESEMRSNPAAA